MFSRLGVHHGDTVLAHPRPPPRQRSPNSFLRCCFGSSSSSSSGDLLPPPKPRPIAPRYTASAPISPTRPFHQLPSGEMLTVTPSALVIRPGPQPILSSPTPTRPRPAYLERSPSHQVLALIPPQVSPETASSLLTELVKPISDKDSFGYIYIYSVAASQEATPEREESVREVGKLLAPPRDRARRPSAAERRLSERIDALARPGSQALNNAAKSDTKTILLKIGRSKNVHRRLNEWNEQCGYKSFLVKSYPRVGAESATSSPAVSPGLKGKGDKRILDSGVPHAAKVERLVHLELASSRVDRACDDCGKVHREWFEIEPSKPALRKLDETIKRWVEWDLRETEKRLA
ncbi:MAG: hypothetical protein M1814_001534 [Vezdaea aestivalis]|nr:MAG: hypothetical protein M1814_001534 [Vezdaea aestivalis]